MNTTEATHQYSEERRFLHDLSNPVSTMTLLMEVLKECPSGGEEERECMERMTHLLARVSQLIQARRKKLIDESGS